jgi:hypothetical protein
MIAVVIIALLFYGSSFFWKKDANTPEGIKTDLPSVKKEMTDLQKKVDQRNAAQMEILNDTQKKATTTE